MPLRQPDEDPADGPELRMSGGRHLGAGSDGIPAIPGVRADEPPLADTSSVHGALADQAARLRIAASWISAG
jgi:hypothetical protein